MAGHTDYTTRFIDEIKRLRIMDPEDDSKFVFGVDFGYYDPPNSIEERNGPIWITAGISGYEDPVLASNGYAPAYQALDQEKYVNNRRYPNKYYVTASSKHGRKLCRYGCLWIFDRDAVDGKEILLSFGVGHELFGADWIRVPVRPTVFDERDVGILNPEVRATGAGIELRAMPDRTNGRDGSAPQPQQVRIHNARPSYDHNPDGVGAWHGYDYELLAEDGFDPRYEHKTVRSGIVRTDAQREGERYRIVTDAVDIAACNLCRVMF